MSFTPFLRLLREGRLTPMLRIAADLKPFYRLTWLAAAGDAGLLGKLASGPAAFDSLAEFFAAHDQGREALEAWLQLGVRLRLLSFSPRGYSLRGLARTLAQPENDAALAMVQEVGGLHHKLISATLPKLRNGELFTLADQDGELIARSSRVLEAFQAEAIHRAFPKQGPLRLLEIGCGSGVYLRYAATHNPSLTAIGLELQPAVAQMARRNLRSWGLDGRVSIEDGDFRALAIPESPCPEATAPKSTRPTGSGDLAMNSNDHGNSGIAVKSISEQFDIVTLYNNIYYFPVAERVALFERIAGFLKAGGFLLLTTCCQGGSLGVEALNLWGAATHGAGRLPAEKELISQLRQAGFCTVKATNLVPGDRFMSFQALRG